MKNFKLEYEYMDQEYLKKEIAKIPALSVDTLNSTSAYLKIFMDNNLITTPFVSSKKFTGSVWLLELCRNMLKVTQLMHEKEVIVRLSVDPGCLKITKLNDKVQIKFLSEFGSTKDKVYGETTIQYLELLNDIYRFLKSFCKDLIEINPKIRYMEEFNQILEGRDKIKQMLEESENGSTQ